MFDGGARVLQRGRNNGRALLGLFCDIKIVRAYRPGAGDVDVVADANARENPMMGS